MIIALMLVLQAAAPATASPPVQPASPRMLSGRFTCDAIVYEVQVTTAPLSAASAVLDRVAIGGKPVDAGSMAEARRMVARLTDVQSRDVRCRAGGAGELSIYGTQAMAGAAPRRARVRGTLQGGAPGAGSGVGHGAGITDLAIAVEQR